jgi:type IV secretion system protein VirD4
VRAKPVRDPSAPRVLLLLGEFGVLGRMRPVEQALAFDRSYGLSVWCVLRDLGQLTGTYPDGWRTFLAGPSVMQVFGTSDIDTAEYFSRRAGETTVSSSSGSRSRRGTAGTDGVSVTEAGVGRRLIFADEILRLPAEEQLLFVRGEAPIRVRRVDYRTDAPFKAFAGSNPLYIRER